VNGACDFDGLYSQYVLRVGFEFGISIFDERKFTHRCAEASSPMRSNFCFLLLPLSERHCKAMVRPVLDVLHQAEQLSPSI